jgi:hypothetical protein
VALGVSGLYLQARFVCILLLVLNPHSQPEESGHERQSQRHEYDDNDCNARGFAKAFANLIQRQQRHGARDGHERRLGPIDPQLGDFPQPTC